MESNNEITTQKIVAAIQKQSQQLERIKDELQQEHHYYVETLNQFPSLEESSLTSEQMVLLGGYFATWRC